MKKILPLLLIGILGIGRAVACSFYPTPFCEVVKTTPNASLLEFTILEHLPNGIRVHIDNVWQGQEFRAEVIIWNREDIDCNGLFPQRTSQYGPVGTKIVASLMLIDTLETAWEQLGDYRGSVFAFTDGFLRLEGNRWRSAYSDLDEGVDIAEGQLSVFLSDCVGYELTPVGPATMTVGPNPADDYVRVLRNWSEDTRITLYDLSGRVVAIEIFGVEELDLSLAGIAEGIYFIESRVGQTVLRQKLVVRRM